MLVSYVPPLISFAATGILTAALYQPRFFVILLSLCSAVAAICVWAVVFVIGIRDFYTQLPFGISIIAFFVICSHCALVPFSMRLEWDPDYESFWQKLRYPRE